MESIMPPPSTTRCCFAAWYASGVSNEPPYPVAGGVSAAYNAIAYQSHTEHPPTHSSAPPEAHLHTHGASYLATRGCTLCHTKPYTQALATA